VADENEMGGNMERIMASLGQDVPETKPILEINPTHPLSGFICTYNAGR
jgi:molecular chaperone HtpG